MYKRELSIVRKIPRRKNEQDKYLRLKTIKRDREGAKTSASLLCSKFKNIHGEKKEFNIGHSAHS